MADDLIYCPSCNFKLQLPPELYGQAVECPQCHARFTAPVPQAAPPVLRPPMPAPADYGPAPYGTGYAADPGALAYQAAGAVRAPAAALLVVSLLAGLMWGLVILSGQSARAQPAVWTAELRQRLNQNPDIKPADRDWILKKFSAENYAYYATLLGGVGVVVNVLTLLGAVMMMRLRGYAWAVLGSVLALNPLNVPCCLLQVPFGVWALAVLMRGEVRQVFR
jgi:hypothetical protein